MRVAAAAIVLACAATATTAARADVLKVGERVAELDVAVDRAGKPFKLASLRGQWFVVTVGAAWCAPCKKELPIWDRLAAKRRGQIAFVAVSVDDDPADGKKFHERLGLAHMRLVYMPQATSAVADRYGATTMPSTFVVDPSGVVRFVKSGFEKNDPDAEYRALDGELDKLAGKTGAADGGRPTANGSNHPDPPSRQVDPATKHEEPKHDDHVIVAASDHEHDHDPPKQTKPPEVAANAPTGSRQPAAGSPSPEPAEPDPAPSGFVFDLDAGFGLGRWGVAAQASGLGAIAVSSTIAVGLRFGVGSVKYASPGYGEYGLVAGAIDVARGKLVFGAAVGAGVVDQHGGLAWDLRGGYEVYRLHANHFVAGVDFVDVYGTHGVAAVTVTVGLHHR